MFESRLKKLTESIPYVIISDREIHACVRHHLRVVKLLEFLTFSCSSF